MEEIYCKIAENIGFLSVFDSTLESAKKNESPSQFSEKAHMNQYTLSLKQEERIAAAFAILLANKKDPKKVGAVCIEERSNPCGLTIRTAINSGSQLFRKDQFFRISRSLMNYAKADSPGSLKDTFWEDVVAACQPRLLSHLHSVHAPGPQKLPLVRRLSQALKLLRDMDNVPEKFVDFENHVNSLIAIFERLERLSELDAKSTKGTVILRELLQNTDRMLSSVDIAAIISIIPKNNPSWSGTACDSLLENLKELVQYKKAAEYLLLMAKRYSLFKNLNILEVRGSPFQDMVQQEAQSPARVGVLFRSANSNNMEKRQLFEKRLQKRLHKNSSEVIRRVTENILEKKRVHAEIQLLFHYEQECSKVLRPRVIYSNKHACFLCNLFIRAHGKFYIPSSHGRLYPKWRIPRLNEIHLCDNSKFSMLHYLSIFNHALEDKINDCLKKGRLALPDPKESIIFPLGSYASTVPLANKEGERCESSPALSEPGTSSSTSAGLLTSDKNHLVTLSDEGKAIQVEPAKVTTSHKKRECLVMLASLHDSSWLDSLTNLLGNTRDDEG